MKIIDFEKKGNLVRFYLGGDNCNDYWGDDWNDAPYEHNAGTVYDRYVKEYIDVCFPFDSLVFEPQDDWRCDNNSHYCKEDMKKNKVPCIIVVPKQFTKDSWEESFGEWVGHKDIYKIYFNDNVNKLYNMACMVMERGIYEE